MSSIQKQKGNFCVLQMCQVPTRISYRKGIEKILENRSVFQNALYLEQHQGNLARERWQSQWTTASVTVQIKFDPVLLRTQNLLKMWQSINGLIKGFRSVLLSLGNVVHQDNDEESLYAYCCTQKVAVKGCHRCSILAVTVHRYLHQVQ